MNKGLKALEELKENVCYFAIGDYAYPRLDIIEKELKEDEMWKAKYTMLEKEHIELMLEKGALKKIVEIIKKKVVLIDVLLESEDVNDYNDFYAKSTDKHLTQEEYDLLKEKLL